MIKNLTRNTVLAQNFSLKTGWGKIRGLIGEKNCKPIVIKTRFGIHTFFLKFPVDIVIIDKNKRIAFFKKNVAPNRVVLWNPKFDTVIELPTGSLDKSRTANGDSIELSL